MEQSSAGDTRTNTARSKRTATFSAIPSDDLAGLILESVNLTEFLAAFAGYVALRCSMDGGDVRCGVTLLPGRRPAVAGFSDHRARLLGELQRDHGSGPGLEAANRQVTVCIADLDDEPLWPEYAAAARAQGVASVAAVPINLLPEGRAALCLHSTRAGHFDETTLLPVENLIRRAEPSLRLAVQFFGHASTARDLKAALESRTVIDQAVGIIMGQNRCSQHEAFTMLRSASGRRNLKLRALAGQIVAAAGGAASPAAHFDS